MENNKHIWSFSTVGGVKRVNLDSGDDLIHLDELDQKLWTALSCPVSDLEIDPNTLSLLDKDKDGQIRVPEVLAAVKWITSVLKNPGDLLKQENQLPLAAIDMGTEAGKTLLASAKTILKNLGKEGASEISVIETSDTEKIFANSPFNGDGVITEDTVVDSSLVLLINDIIACVGSQQDLGGKPGINRLLLEQFIENAHLYLSWYDKAETKPDILPFGERTEEAFLCYQSLQGKVNDYFIRCRLALFDPQTTDALNLTIARVESISSKNFSESIGDIAEYPLAKVEGGKALPLMVGINPAWEQPILLFKSLIMDNVLPGSNSLSEQEWNNLSAKFADYGQWKSEKEGAIVEPLGPSRIKEIINGNQLPTLFDFIEQDLRLETEAANIILVDQLVRYYCHLFTLLKNFVTFYDFYSSGYKAIFQAGTLFIDQRSCSLCIKVNDLAKHDKMVSYSGMFLIYCECISRATNEKMIIVAALTNGDIDNLVVGRNAVFYDRNGLDWDASVIKIVDNPISIRQGFWSPYRKVSKFIETQVNKFAAAEDEKMMASANKSIEETPNKLVETSAAPKPPAPPFDIGKFVGIFAAISLALGAIGTAIASVIAGFISLVWWKMPLALLGIILLISGPSMIMAYLKLRKRNLAPILDANGWAINANVIVNIPFGNLLTHLAQLPAGAKINLNDPFTKKKRPFWPFAVAIGLITAGVLYLLWKYGLIHINI